MGRAVLFRVDLYLIFILEKDCLFFNEINKKFNGAEKKTSVRSLKQCTNSKR